MFLKLLRHDGGNVHFLNNYKRRAKSLTMHRKNYLALYLLQVNSRGININAATKCIVLTASHQP